MTITAPERTDECRAAIGWTKTRAEGARLTVPPLQAGDHMLLAQEERAVWHVLVEGEYQVLAPDDHGILRSQVFPGLWLHPERFWAGDLAGLIAVLDQGLASPDHAGFVASMAAAGQA